MKNSSSLPSSILTTLLLVGACGAAYHWREDLQVQIQKLMNKNAANTDPAAKDPNAPSTETVAAKPKYPVATSPNAFTGAGLSPTETIESMDKSLAQEITNLIKPDLLSLFVSPENLVQKFVATIDSLKGKRLPLQVLPLRLPKGKFQVNTSKDRISTINPNNYKRYAQYLDLMDAIDNQKLMEMYKKYYPQMQNIYHETNPNGFFNDRFVEVIDNVLATPDVNGSAQLVQPAVFFKYTDANLEELSAAQRFLLRAGPENSKRIKNKLMQLRESLTHQ